MKPADTTLARTGAPQPPHAYQKGNDLASAASAPSRSHPQGAPAPRSGAVLLVDALKIHGVDMAFGVPGESYLAVLDALHDRPEIKFVICRQEGGAANMADAYGKLTGRPGICFVTRGPGAANASLGIHTAFQDSTPVILFIGQGRQRRRRA